MPGDPNECRQHALNCMLLAKEASSEERKQRFINLAQSWSRLAAELEGAEALLDTVDGMEFKNAPEKTGLSDEESTKPNRTR